LPCNNVTDKWFFRLNNQWSGCGKFPLLEQTTPRRKTKMQKKKKTAKVRDLKPAKDAKGGGFGGQTPKPVFGPPPT